MTGRGARRLILLLAVAAAVGVFFAAGLHRHLTLEALKSQQGRLQALFAERPAAVIGGFLAVYIPVVALNLPGAAVLGLAAGALFGTLAGTILISFASSIGATLACALSRYLFRGWVQRRFGDKLKRVNAGIAEEGAFYLFSLRLIPVIPFFIINLTMGLTPIRLTTFYWVSQLGMLPGTAVYVNAGSQLGRIESLGGILSPALLLSFALIGVLPLCMRRLLRFYRDRFRKETAPAAADGDKAAAPPPPPLAPLLAELRERCTACGACVKSCAFLGHYGTPRAIAEKCGFATPREQTIAYECSLCGLCGAVCPEKLDPARLFLEVRRQHVAEGHFAADYGAILGYEKRGTSPLFSWYGLPAGCDTVFFPGCTLPGTRPETTRRMFAELRRTFPALGIVFDCCTKPSHDLGRQAHFEAVFGEMRGYLERHGIARVITACPNCFKIFQQYGEGLTVQMAYEFLQADAGAGVDGGREVVVHDPCPLRHETTVHQAVRRLVGGMGLSAAEMKHHGRRTVCCGEGGMVGFVRAEWAKAWGAIRKAEARGRPMVAYCAGCAGFLSRVSPTVHVADLLYHREAALNGKAKVARPPFTYWNRWRLKRRFQADLDVATSRQRRLDGIGGNGRP